MSSSVAFRKNSLSMEFIKRTAGLVTGAAGSYMSEAMPTTVPTLIEARRTVKEVGSTLANTSQDVLSKARGLKSQNPIREIYRWYMDKDNEFDDSGFDTELQFDTDIDVSAIADVQINEAEKNANKVAKAVVQSSKQMVDAQITGIANIQTTLDKQTAVISAGFDKTNETLNKILEVVTKNSATLIETTVAASNSNNPVNDMMRTGRFNANSFKKMVTANIKNSSGYTLLSMLPMMLSQGVSPDEVVKGLLTFGLDRASPNLKKNLKALDDAVNDTIMHSLIRLGNTARKNPFSFGGIIGSLIGFDTTRKTQSTQRSTFEVKATSFDTITKEAITNAIPGYLRKILVALGGDDLVYDYRSRNFKTKAAIRKDFINAGITNTNSMYQASSTVRNALSGTNNAKTTGMLYQMLLTQLGAEDDMTRTLESFKDPKALEAYMKKMTKGVRFNKTERQDMDSFMKAIQSLTGSNNGIMDMAMQASKSNLQRNAQMSRYIADADKYNIDLSEFSDSIGNDIEAILAKYGKRPGRKGRGASSAAPMNPRRMSGVDYTNAALYQIFRRLDEGINVFQVGRSNDQGSKFEKWGDEHLPPPVRYKPRTVRNASKAGPLAGASNEGLRRSEDAGPNLLINQTDEEGNVENLTGGQRAGRWAKSRGKQLQRALFSGSPEEVRGAFANIVNDITGAAGDQLKKGASKFNQSHGNITGYLRHKITGAGYKYTEDGKEYEVKKNEKGGYLGYFDEMLFGPGGAKAALKNTGSMASKWFKSIGSYFNYGDKEKGEKSDIGSKRKRILGLSIGAIAGAGLIGGPIGLILGGIAGNALSQTTGIGGKIHKLLFGDKDHEGDTKKDRKKRRGLIGRVVDNITDPIRYQIGKTMTAFGGVLKKNILGPLSNIGHAIKERMSNAAGGVVSKVFGKIFGGMGGLLKKLIMLPLNIAKAPITLLGNMTRAGAEAGGAVVGGALNTVARVIAGKKGRDSINARIRGQKHDVEIDKAESGYYGDYEFDYEQDPDGPRGRMIKVAKKTSKGRGYKAWKERQEIERDKRNVSDYTSEEVVEVQSEIAKTNQEIAEATRETAESSKKSEEATVGLHELGSKEGSIFTHDAGLHERLDEIISIMRGDKKTSALETEKQSNMTFANTLIGAATQAGDEGGYSQEDVTELEGIASGATVGESKNSMFSRFKKILQRNKNKADQSGDGSEKKESNWLKEIISDYWPVLAGGLALLNENVREFLANALSKLGNWLLENVPSILKGVWDFATDVNREVENNATGATTEVDPVTGEKKSVISAEEHAAKIEQGVLSSAAESTLDPMRMLKDTAIIAGERSLIRHGANLVTAGAKVTGLGGKVVSGLGKIGNAITKGVQSGGSFIQGIKQYGLNKVGLSKGMQFASITRTLGGSQTASAVTSAGKAVTSGAAKVASGSKNLSNMLGKMTNPKTWLKPSAVGNILGGVATDIVASMSWDATETAKNKNIVGDYGLGQAGGYVQTSTTAKTITTTTLATAGGIAIGAAVQAAITGVGVFAAANGWNPVGWCAAIIAGVLALAAGLAALINWIVGLVTDGANIDYSVRSNSAKLNAVVNDNVNYKSGGTNPMYVYCGQESDRVLGFTKGMHMKDPDLVFGKFLKTIADGLASQPGTEVLLYDWINNMAVQGVPFACLFAGDSKEVGQGGDQANKDSCGDPPSTSSGWFGVQNTQVKKSTVRKNKKKVFSDISANISRTDQSLVFTEENVEYIYDVGKDVVKALTKESILKDNGEVNTNKFKGNVGSGKNDEGWKSLDKICRAEGSYFLTKCLVYINSKVEANKEGQQWLQVKENDIVKLLDGLKDFITGEKDAAIAEMKASGMSQEEIDAVMAGNTDPGGKEAEAAAAPVTDNSAISKAVNSSSIRSGDKEDVKKELKLISATYAYSHPDVLQRWVNSHPEENKNLDVDYRSKLSSWNTSEFTRDGRKGKMLRAEIGNAARNFAESQDDIFNLVDMFDWAAGGKIYTGNSKDPGEKHGSGFVFRGEKKSPGEGILDKLWNDPNKPIQERKPDDVHKELFGQKDHGKASEADKPGSTDWTVGGNGVLGRIAEMIQNYGSAKGLTLGNGDHKDKWRNILTNIPAHSPPNLAIGGPIDSMTMLSDGGGSSDATIADQEMAAEGGNPLNKPFQVNSYFGWRDLNNNPADGKEDWHKGIDLAPSTSDGTDTEVGARYSGTISKVVSHVTDGYLGKSTDSGGNMVWIKTDDGYTIKNMHLAPNSIPSNIVEGARVNVGDKLGLMGSTGNSSGPHLHYQIDDPSGKEMDPLSDVSGGSTVSAFNSTSPGVHQSYSSSYYNSSGSTSSASSSTPTTGAFARFIEALKSMGSTILNKITGGLFGDSQASSTVNQDASVYSTGNYYSTHNYSGYTGTIRNVDDFLAMCEAEVGTTEYPDAQGKYHNQCKYNDWYWGDGSYKSGGGHAWCMAFVQWCFNQAGLPLEEKTASCTTLVNWYKSHHPERIITTSPKPGDIVMFKFSHNTNEFNHTGIVKQVINDKHVIAIEGNTGKPGNQDEQGVWIKDRDVGIVCYIRAVDWDVFAASMNSSSLGGNIASGDVGALYEYLVNNGFSKTAAAGVLGCWTAESANDPDTIEADYLIPNLDKNALITDRQRMNDYVRNHVWPKTKGVDDDSDGDSAYYGKDRNLYPGIGYAQWTGERGEEFLKFVNKDMSRPWSDASLQLDYMNSELDGQTMGGYYGPKHLNVRGKMAAVATPSEAANTFAKYYEGNRKGADSDRIRAAENIYNTYANQVTQVPLDEYGVGGPIDGEGSTIRQSTYVPVSRASRSRGRRTISSAARGGMITTTPSSFNSTRVPVSDNQYTSLNFPAGVDNDQLQAVLMSVLTELRYITQNTGSSSDLLGELNTKEFVDKGLRDSISAASKSKGSKSSTGATAAASMSGSRTALTLARPHS